MRYDLAKISLPELFEPALKAVAGLARLDERVARSAFGQGWIDRTHFGDACASLWVDGELVHLEDLVLHDAAMGIRAPSHELTIAHDVLRSRRRIAEQPAGWAVSVEGLSRLRGGSDHLAGASAYSAPLPEALETKGMPDDATDPLSDSMADPLSGHLAAIDAILERSEALLADAATVRTHAPKERDPFLYEPDWDEEERLSEWQFVLSETAAMHPALQAAIALDAWNRLQVLQHAPWLGRLLAASLLRAGGLTVHLPTLNSGLKLVARDRRTSRDRTVRLTAILEAFALAADLGLKEHDRLLLARQQMDRRLAGRRSSSKLPQLVDLVLSRPIVSGGMIAEALGVTPQGALKIAAELNLRELTGRGRFRAWGIL
ncbi:RHE_PE00001 family protein [Neorhizobium alkalisoli]|uniref:DNA binding protein with HTH domain n=1 Tax=Neorhizobium alkalisoli TaxID=528178 RepID=A0A561R8X4_9HYPH|nr:RHE_PE00001 family protein [Neorhizobium alkalisoli]TWF59059.1 DNA binding protein with HTH domain [Neorhizobium alkalisoli]